jgi:chitinase
MRCFGMFLLAAILTASPLHAEDGGAVVGYIAAFKGFDREVQQPGIAKYTHLIVAFVNPTPSGEVVGTGALACAPAVNEKASAMIPDAQLRALVAAAHRRGTKVIASLGGAVIPRCGGDWGQLLQPQSRERLISNLVGMVDRYELDGLDVDLEGDLMTQIDKAGNYMPFVQALSEALHARSKMLTAATGSYPGGMVPDVALPLFDLIGIMSYDQVGPTWGTPGGEHSTYAQAETDLALWIRKGVPATKLALGMPFYGRGFGSFRAGWSLADIASEFGKRQLGSDVAGQRCAGCSYVTYNGLPTLERKAELAGAWGAGVMVWEVGQDLPDGSAIEHVARAYEKGRSYARKQR